MGAQEMCVGARFRTGHPHGSAFARRDQAIAGYSHLELNERTALGHAQDMACCDPPRLLLAQSDVDRDTGLAQDRYAAAGYLGVGIFGGAHHAPHAGGKDRLGARHGLADQRICAAVIRAGLERDVHGLPARPVAGNRQRMRLGVRTAARLRPSPRHDFARRLIGDDGADGRIGGGLAVDAPRHVQGEHHEPAILRAVRRNGLVGFHRVQCFLPAA